MSKHINRYKSKTMYLNTIFLLALLLLETGCQSTVSNPLIVTPQMQVGAEKVALNKLPLSVRVRLESYLSYTTPLFFFIANDGGHTMSWVCHEDYRDYDGELEFREAQQECEILRLGMGCTLLYLGKKPLFNNIEFKGKLTSLQLSGDVSIQATDAVGKIIYMPGYSGWDSDGYNFLPALTDDELSPVLEKLESYGWDIDVLNILHADRTYLSDDYDLLKQLLSGAILVARNQGYERVVLYGGSRGGAEIMRSVIAGVNADAIALMEPDWHGPKYDDRGQYNQDDKTRKREVRKLLAKQKVDRVVFSFFKNSRWYGDYTPSEIDETLGISGSEYFLIAAPEDLEGHGGSWTYRFSNLYAHCIHQFFVAHINSYKECEPSKIDNTKHENWATNKWVKQGNYPSLKGKEILNYLDGKGLCRYYPASKSTSKYNCLIWDQDGRRRSFTNEFNQLLISNDLIDLKKDGFCRHNGLYSPTYQCSGFYLIEEDLVAILPKEKNNFYWYRRVEKKKIEEMFKEASFNCLNTSKLDSVFCHDIR